MRRLLHLLVVIAVLFCALHVGEDAYAFDSAHAGEAASVPMEGDHDGSASSEAAAHTIHHHCPVSDDLCGVPAFAGMTPIGGLLFAPPVAALGSLSQAPPTEPPLA